MLKSSHHPYQTTTYPYGRNPWAEKQETSTNSSCGSRSAHTARNLPSTSEHLLPRSQTVSHHGPLLNQQIHPVVVPTQGLSSVLNTVHGSSGAISTTGGVGSCGGQCIACETFCYYCLQVVFIAGILTGIALTIAGSVLHESQREGDLVVLMYIGVLLVLVCILLLSVHCCVRRNVKERKRALRLTLMESTRRVIPPADVPSIPVQEFVVNQPFRNSFTETNLNGFDFPESARTLPNPALHYQSRLIPANRSVRVFSYERCPQGLELHDQQSFERGKLYR